MKASVSVRFLFFNYNMTCRFSILVCFLFTLDLTVYDSCVMTLEILFHKGAMLFSESSNMAPNLFSTSISSTMLSSTQAIKCQLCKTIALSSMVLYDGNSPLLVPHLVYMSSAWLVQMGQEITGSTLES